MLEMETAKEVPVFPNTNQDSQSRSHKPKPVPSDPVGVPFLAHFADVPGSSRSEVFFPFSPCVDHEHLTPARSRYLRPWCWSINKSRPETSAMVGFWMLCMSGIESGVIVIVVAKAVILKETRHRYW